MNTTTRCARCGREIQAGAYLCDRCREEEGPSLGTRVKPPSDLETRAGRWPTWIPKPSPVQYHATIGAVIVLVLAGLAAFAFLNHRGVGPFRGDAVHREFVPPATLRVDVQVTNEGSKTSRANCHIAALVGGFAEASDSVLTDPIPGGQTVRFRHTLTGVETAPKDMRVAVTCN